MYMYIYIILLINVRLLHTGSYAYKNTSAKEGRVTNLLNTYILFTDHDDILFWASIFYEDIIGFLFVCL
jgi:hypothetical protein